MSNLIIVPIHPPYFDWAKQLLDSASSEENIALGFSNQNDANSFSHPFPFQTLISNVPEGEEGYINKKKFDILRQVYQNYQYVSIIDAEAKFISPVTPILEDIWNSNCFLANHSANGYKYVKDIADMCNYDYSDDLYPWFNCMPIYKSDLLPDFFKWLDDRKHILNSYYSFEFLIFALYCRYELNLPWKILEGHSWDGLVEFADDWKNNTHLHNQVMWSTYFEGVEKLPNIKMLFHLDRFKINE
jgi:hypothetical protein